jgi:DNA-binding CsgD family transcriptional regulator
MVPGRAGRLNRTSCGIVLIGQSPLLRKRIEFALRAAGYQIAASVPDADLAFLRTIPCEQQIVAVFEVNDSVGSRNSIPKKKQNSLRAGKSTEAIQERAASSRAVTPAATAEERSFTPRQAMILKSLMNGDSNKAVAHRLCIAEETVKVHIKRLLRRIGVKNRTQAAIWAMNNNFTSTLVSEVGDLWPARSVAKPRSAMPCTAPKTEFEAPSGPPLSRARGRKAKRSGRSILEA